MRTSPDSSAVRPTPVCRYARARQHPAGHAHHPTRARQHQQRGLGRGRQLEHSALVEGAGELHRAVEAALRQVHDELDLILVWRLDRLGAVAGRSGHDTSRVNRTPCPASSSLSRALDLTTPSGRAWLVWRCFRQLKRDILRDRVKAGIAQAHKEGRPHREAPDHRQALGRGEKALPGRGGGVHKREIAQEAGHWAKVQSSTSSNLSVQFFSFRGVSPFRIVTAHRFMSLRRPLMRIPPGVSKLTFFKESSTNERDCGRPFRDLRQSFAQRIRRSRDDDYGN